MMNKNEATVCCVAIIYLVTGFLFVYCKDLPRKTLKEIEAIYQQYDPKLALTVPEERKDACLEWAFGKDWEKIAWNYRADKFRELHPKLNLEDFADVTPTKIFWERVSSAYVGHLESNEEWNERVSKKK